MTKKAGFLLDTNVISETRRVRPDPGVIGFLNETHGERLFISGLTLGELRKGVEIKRRSDPEQALRLEDWVDGIGQKFADRVLAVDADVARRWGEISADRPRPAIDTLIAATALVNGLTLVTRNSSDIVGIKLEVLNPWTDG